MKLEPESSDEEPEAAEAAAPVAVADTAAVAVVEPTPLVKAPATPSAPDPETSRSASPPTLSPTSPAFPELETGGDQDDNDDDWQRRQRRRMAPEAVQGNLLNVLESMTAAIAEAKEKAAAATSSTSDLAIAEVLDTFLLCMDQMDNVLTGGVIDDRSRHQRLREEKAAMELQSDMLAALSELKHYKGSKGAFVEVAITNVLDRRIRFGQTTKNHWLRMIMPLSEARAFLGESVLGPGRLEANAASVNLHSWWRLSVANGNATFTPALNLRLTHGVVQVNVNGFELSPDALAGVRMHQFRVFRGAAISRGAVTSRGHDRAAISRGAVTSRGHDRAQPANSGSRGSGSVGTAASASNDDDDAKGFAAIVERALLAHARSQLLRPKLAALPWAIANLGDMPVILWAQFVYSRDDDNAACAGTPSASGTGGSAGSLGSGIGQWWQPSHWHWLVGWPHWQPQPDTTEQSHWQWQWPWQP